MGVLMRIAWRNLWRGWRRSAVVVTAIASGLWGTLVLVAWTVGLTRQMTDTAVRTQLGHLAVHAEGYHASPDPERSIPDSGRRIVEELSTRGGVHAAPRLQGGGLIQSARRSSRAALVGVVPALERDVSSVADSLVVGSYLEAPAGRRSRPILIGAELAERLRVGLGDKVVMRVPGDYGLGAFRVGGIYRTVSAAFDEVFVFVALEDAQRLLDVGDRVTAVVAALDDPDAGPVVQSWAQTRLGEVLPEQRLEVLTWQEREPRLATMLDMMGTFRWIFYAVVFVAMAFGIANVLLAAVYERIREFGVMRSLGLQARRLIVLVLLEAVLLTVAGTAVGLGIGIPVVLWVGQVGLELTVFSDALRDYGIGVRMYPAVELADVLVPVTLAVVTAVLSALWPALKAARLRPAEALRHV